MHYRSWKLNICRGTVIAAMLGITALANTQPGGLEATFATPPPEFKPWIWWHWMNGHISKEGIRADLQAMKKAGIGGAQIFDIGGMEEMPEGPVAFMSPEWLDLFRGALEEADKQGLQIGVNCSAGWANSGGPWVGLEDSMKRLVASRTTVRGPGKFSGTLEKGKSPGPRNAFYKDVALFAVNADDRLLKPMKVDSSLGEIDADKLQSDDRDFSLAFPQGNENSVLFDFGEPTAPATLFLRFAQLDVYLHGEVLSSNDGTHFRSIRKFDFANRWLPLNLYPLAIDSAGSPPCARYFKVVLYPQSRKERPELTQTKVAALWFSPQFTVDNASAKSGDGEQEYDFPQPSQVTASRGASIMDISGKLSASGSLEWDVPSGEWVLLRIGVISTGAGPHPVRESSRGFECDKLERQAFDRHWNSMIVPLLKKAEGTRAFTNTLIDSYEVSGQNWSGPIVEYFRAARGYDPVPFLPAVFGISVGSKDSSERFLYDWRTSVSELMAQNYYSYFAERCAKAGLQSFIEPYWGQFDCITAGKAATVPMGEFWFSRKGEEKAYSRIPSSIGHLYGKEVVAAESFTSCDFNRQSGKAGNVWRETPFLMKAGGDRQFCAGINRMVLHSYVHQPFTDPRAKPGITLGIFGSHFGRNQTWWPFAGAWTDYLSRCQLLLRQGRSRADVCIFAGENAPNHAFEDGGFGGSPGSSLKKIGYDYDICDVETAASRLSVDANGQIQVPSGVSYTLLSVNDASLMSVWVLKAIERLLNDGAVVCSQKPRRTPGLSGYPDSEKELMAIADRIWGREPVSKGSAQVGKGRIFWGMTESEVLDAIKLEPDFKVEDQSGLDIGWVHRSTGDREIYFLSNQPDRTVNFIASFRGTGFEPEFWNPERGTVEKCALYSEKDGRMRIPVSLPESGSIFVVLKRVPEPTLHAVSLSFVPLERSETLSIKKAVYGATDGSTGQDVTTLLQNTISGNKLQIGVNNAAMGGDPAPNHPKQLSVEYVLDGKEGKADVPEYGNFSLASTKTKVEEPAGVCCLEKTVDGNFSASFSGNGSAKVVWATGRSSELQCKDIPAPLSLDGPWRLRFPPGHGAPETAVFEKLSPLSESSDEGIRHFSGIVTYEKEFTVSQVFFGENGRRYALCLASLGDGGVARVELNGVDVGIVWSAPFEVDVSRALRQGTNRLVVKLATPWANRLIGDEKFPRKAEEWEGWHLKSIPDWLKNGEPRSDGRVAFTFRTVFTQDTPLARSGLPGPVVIRASQRIVVEK